MEIIIKGLKKSNEFLNTILDNINSAVFIVDSNFLVHDINNSCKVLLKKSYEDLTGKLLGNAISCIHAVDHNENCGKTPYCPECLLRKSIDNTFKNKSGFSKLVLDRDIKTAKRSIRKIFQYSTRHFIYNKNEMTIVIVDDITTFEFQKTRLKKLNEEKNKFISYAVHDLRSPMTVIQMYIEYFMEFQSKNLDAKQIKTIKKLLESTHFMLELINDILHITKIESDKISIKKAEYDYIAFVKENIEANQMLAEKKGIDIIFESKIKEEVFSFDKKRISEVLGNLISNAIKYSNTGTKIRIAVKKDKNDMLTEIIDQGLGIKENELDKLFRPFQKTSTRATAGESSTGLGLAITKKILKAHGGGINVKSKVNEGSNFYFTIPMK